MSRFDRVHFLLPLVTLFCIVSHIWPNIGRKSRQLYNPTCIHRPRRNFAKMFSNWENWNDWATYAEESIVMC